MPKGIYKRKPLAPKKAKRKPKFTTITEASLAREEGRKFGLRQALSIVAGTKAAEEVLHDDGVVLEVLDKVMLALKKL